LGIHFWHARHSLPNLERLYSDKVWAYIEQKKIAEILFFQDFLSYPVHAYTQTHVETASMALFPSSGIKKDTVLLASRKRANYCDVVVENERLCSSIPAVSCESRPYSDLRFSRDWLSGDSASSRHRVANDPPRKSSRFRSL